MTTNYDLTRVIERYSRRIRHHQMLWTILLVANLIFWPIAFLIAFGCV
jgi:hypothetical protein